MAKRKFWTNEEEMLLISLVESKKNITEVSEELERSERAIKHRLEKLRKELDDVPYFRNYAQEENDLLTSFSNDPESDTSEDIAKFLGRTRNSVNSRLQRMRKTDNYVDYIQRPWSDREDERLIKLKGKHTYQEIGEILNRSRSAITHRCIILGIAQRKFDFSQIGEEIRVLAAKGYTRKEISEELSIEYNKIRNFIYRNKIDCKNSSPEITEKQKQEHSNFLKRAFGRY